MLVGRSLLGHVKNEVRCEPDTMLRFFEGKGMMSLLSSVKRYAFMLIRFVTSKTKPKIRFLIVLLIAVSMAEFVALDVGIVLAAGILFYIEAVFGSWGFAIGSRFLPVVYAFSVIIMLKIDSLSKFYLKK